jgi:2-polyprenyl-6-methoxyphenol hydroxylase-like FAD-dependent oxidoreductase
MEIAVFGAGIAGLMSAITLRRRGHKCRVYERSCQAHGAGMGFILAPEGIARLEACGVRLSGDVGGRELESYICRDSHGRIVFEQPMPSGTRSIRRRDLATALTRALGEEETLVFGGELVNLEFNEDFHISAARLKSSAGSSPIEADLYVGADGVNSQARRALFPDWPTTLARVPEIVGLVRCEKAVQWAGRSLNKFHADDGGTALGVLPVDSEHVVWYLQFDALRFPMSRAVMDGFGRGGAEARWRFVRNLVQGWAHPVPSLVAATDFWQAHLWRPIDTDLIPHFHRGNLVLVGDAAHPFSPFTSQGVTSAIVDAVVLARELNDASPANALEEALSRYSAERHAQCAGYVAKGRELMENFLGPLSGSSTMLPMAVGTGA